MTVEKPKPKQLLRPITTGAGSAMNQSQFLAIICKTCSKRGKNHAYMTRLVLVLLLIGWKTGTSLLSQSLSVAIAISQLLSTVIWKLLYWSCFHCFFFLSFLYLRRCLLWWVPRSLCSMLWPQRNVRYPCKAWSRSKQTGHIWKHCATSVCYTQ